VAKRKRPAEPRHGRPDERVRRSKEAVLAATVQLLSETGFGGVSVDAVAARSGVAKTTIYRHWPSRSALLVEACSKLGSKPNTPDTGSLKGDVAVLAAYMAERLRTQGFARVLPSVIDAAERDPEIAAVYTSLHAGVMAPLYAVLERAQRRGELPRGCVAADVVAAIAGPLFYRRWFSRDALDDRFVRVVVERAVSGWK
jgi:AcrR family transcriptional regulator